jgi:hypothetical protein
MNRPAPPFAFGSNIDGKAGMTPPMPLRNPLRAFIGCLGPMTVAGLLAGGCAQTPAVQSSQLARPQGIIEVFTSGIGRSTGPMQDVLMTELAADAVAVIDGAGHALLPEQPERLAALVLDFLKRR